MTGNANNLQTVYPLPPPPQKACQFDKIDTILEKYFADGLRLDFIGLSNFKKQYENEFGEEFLGDEDSLKLYFNQKVNIVEYESNNFFYINVACIKYLIEIYSEHQKKIDCEYLMEKVVQFHIYTESLLKIVLKALNPDISFKEKKNVKTYLGCTYSKSTLKEIESHLRASIKSGGKSRKLAENFTELLNDEQTIFKNSTLITEKDISIFYEIHKDNLWEYKEIKVIENWLPLVKKIYNLKGNN
ncbi:hypothetical protein AGMMS49938_13860 [Fibrobacterales bacterium]|nr:hypothetical protein AGMMS49938_13860 [Fibrobacterales bacterium]